MAIIFSLGVLLAVALVEVLLAYYVLRSSRSRLLRLVVLVVCIAAAGICPWLFKNLIIRWNVSMWAVVCAFRLCEVAFHKFADPALQKTFFRFILFFFCAPDAHFCPTSAFKASARRSGAARFVRGSVKICAAVLLIILNNSLLQVTAEPGRIGIFSRVWHIWMMYFFFSGECDLLTGAQMLLGVKLGEMFDSPFLADSPRDFWGRRWNLAFRNAVRRLIFLPLGGARRPLIGVPVTFFVSALIHEYLTFATLGHTRGEMAVFFCIHGAATILQGALMGSSRESKDDGWRWFKIALHFVWMCYTSFYFFSPLCEIFPTASYRFPDLLYPSYWGPLE